jgi:hypothetical protein
MAMTVPSTVNGRSKPKLHQMCCEEVRSPSTCEELTQMVIVFSASSFIESKFTTSSHNIE